MLRRRKGQASDATGIRPLVPADVPGDDLVVLQDEHGLLLTGPDDLVAGMVAHLRSVDVHPESAEAQPQSLLQRASGLSTLQSLAGLAPTPGSRSAEYVRLTDRSRALLEQHGSIPGAKGTFKGYVRGADGQFAGILDWSPATVDPAQMMTLQSAAVGLALQTAIAQVQESIERVEDKVDRLTDLVSSEHVGKVVGQHRVLVPLVERATTDQTLSVTDWTSVAALGPEVAQTIEALRSYVSKRLDRVHRKRTPTGKAEELRDLLDDGMLREAMAMLVIAEDNLRLWQHLRIVNVRLREPEHLSATIDAARAGLVADDEADQALVSAMGVVVGELMETRPLHGFDVVGVRRLDQAGNDVVDLMHAFAENRMLEVESIEEYQRPGVRAAFGHVGSKILQAAKAAPSAVPFVRSGAPALPAGEETTEGDGDGPAQLGGGVPESR